MTTYRRTALQPNPCFGPVVLPDGSVFIPTGPPMFVDERGAFRTNPERRIRLRDYAHIVLGLSPGQNKYETFQLPSVLPYRSQHGREMSPSEVRDFAMKLRMSQRNSADQRLRPKTVGATIIPQKGVWKGGQETSMTLMVINDGRTKETRAKFERNMRDLAFSLTQHLGQSVVFLTLFRRGAAAVAYEMTHEWYKLKRRPV